MIRIGTKAPEFKIPSGEGEPVSLKNFRGKKIVLYFYPKDMTSGCTKEACTFEDNLRAIEQKGAVVIGVSADSVDSHKRFAEKYGLSFPLLSDERREIVKKYGVWKEKSMYGKKYFGIERSTFVIDEQGVLRHIFSKVKVDGHVDEVLAVL